MTATRCVSVTCTPKASRLLSIDHVHVNLLTRWTPIQQDHCCETCIDLYVTPGTFKLMCARVISESSACVTAAALSLPLQYQIIFNHMSDVSYDAKYDAIDCWWCCG